MGATANAAFREVEACGCSCRVDEACGCSIVNAAFTGWLKLVGAAAECGCDCRISEFSSA